MKLAHRPDKPHLPIYIVFALLTALFALLVFLGRDYLQVPPTRTGLDFTYPYSARMSPRGLIVLTDSGERRILGLSSKGELQFILKGRQRNGGFFKGRILGFDQSGAFYIDDTVSDLKSDNVEARRIQKFSPSGQFLGTVLEYKFTGEAMSDWESHPIFGQLQGDVLYWFKKGEDGTWELIALDLSRTGEPSTTALPGIDVYNTLGAVVLSSSEIWFLHTDGHIEQWTPETTSVQSTSTAGSNRDTDTKAFRLRFPTALTAGKDGTLLAVDAKSRVYQFTSGTINNPDLIIDGLYYTDDGKSGPIMFQTLATSPDGGYILCDELSGSLLRIGQNGLAHVLKAAQFSIKFRILHLGSWIALLLGAACTLGTIIALYIRILGFRTPLLLKQLSIMVPVIALMVASVAIYVYQSLSETLSSQLRDRLVHLAHQGAGRVDPQAAASIQFRTASYQGILGSPEARKLIEVMDELVNLNEDPWDSSIFPYIYIKEQSTWWVLGSFDYLEPYPYPKQEHQEVLDTGEYRFFRYNDIYGAWLSAMAPIKDEKGITVGIFEVCMSGDSLDEAGQRFAVRALLGGSAIVIVFLLMIIGFTYILLRSVRKLQLGVNQISHGDYDTRVDIESRDEIEDLGEAFNDMSAEIKNYISRLADFSRANARFVPREFIASLGKDSIVNVRLGDQILTEMTVLFSDIRDFTTISERLGPQETIKLLNEYLSRMGPVIRTCGGFIDKYIGDAIMALFPHPADQAIQAMQGMMEALDHYNISLQEAGKPALRSGIGIHTGPLMLGIIGEMERYEGTAIADTVNLASRLESLTKYYGVHALVSGQTVTRLEQKHYPLRFIDIVQVKGKAHSVRIYELVSQSDPLQEKKLTERKLYQQAFEQYARGDFTGAAESFTAYLDSVGDDPPALLLLERCHRYMQEKAPAGWNGITIFSEK